MDRLLGQSTALDLILTAKDPKCGQEALERFSEKHASSPTHLTFHQLDVSDSDSIDKFVK